MADVFVWLPGSVLIGPANPLHQVHLLAVDDLAIQDLLHLVESFIVFLVDPELS